MAPDHSEVIARLRSEAESVHLHPVEAVRKRAAAALLQTHDDTGLSLDRDDDMRAFVESEVGHPIAENGA